LIAHKIFWYNAGEVKSLRRGSTGISLNKKVKSQIDAQHESKNGGCKTSLFLTA